MKCDETKKGAENVQAQAPDFCAECEADPNVPPAHSTLYDGKLHGHGICLNCGRSTVERKEDQSSMGRVVFSAELRFNGGKFALEDFRFERVGKAM